LQSGYNKFDMPPRTVISAGNSSKDMLPNQTLILPYSTASHTVEPLLLDLGTQKGQQRDMVFWIKHLLV
jgi:hypothetical protein